MEIPKANTTRQVSTKIRFLREMEGETLAQVADSVGYSTQLVSAWEKGIRLPSFDTLISLGKHFHINYKFLLSKTTVPDYTSAVFFRKAAVLPKRKILQAKDKGRLYALVDGEVSTQLKLPSFVPIPFMNMCQQFKPINYSDIDRIAEQVRDLFELDDGPIENMTLLVERLGIRVVFSDLESEKVDAVTGWVQNRPYIVLNSRRLSSARIRFNLAHELGHIILHSHYLIQYVNNTSNHRTIEAEANHFAGALLMPATGLSMDMMQTNMNYLIELKAHWKVAIQALIYRGNELGLIPDSQALFLRQTIYRNDWRKNEPLDHDIPIEEPSYIQSALSYSNVSPIGVLHNVSLQTGLDVDEISEALSFEVSPAVKSQRNGLHLL